MPEPKIFKARAVKRELFSRSPVDILIAFHGCYEKVAKLVSNIIRVTRSNPYLITLIDDGSPNKEFIKSLKAVPQVNTIRCEKQLGFGGALLQGFLVTKQPWVCFLHSDVDVQDGGWLIEMGRSLIKLKEQGVRMISARSNNPGDGFEFLKADKGEVCQDKVLEEGQILPLYCCMAHRELFTHIKGFVKNYPVAGYEDEELAYRMKYYGFKQGISRSWVFHHGSETKKFLSNKMDISKIIEENRIRCEEDLKKLYSAHK